MVNFLDVSTLESLFPNAGFDFDPLRIKFSPIDPKIVSWRLWLDELKSNEREYSDELLHVSLFTKIFRLWLRYLPFFLQIAFVSDNILFNARVRIFINLLQPTADMIKTGAICDIVNNGYAIGTAIVTTCDSFESILTRCVPLNIVGFTICNLICCPLTVKYLIFYLLSNIRNRRRWYCSNCKQIYDHYIGVRVRFCLLQSCLLTEF